MPGGRVEDYPLYVVRVVVPYPPCVHQPVNHRLEHRHSRSDIGEASVFVAWPHIDGKQRQELVAGFWGAEGLPPVPECGLPEFFGVAVVVPPVRPHSVVHRPSPAWYLNVSEVLLMRYHLYSPDYPASVNLLSTSVNLPVGGLPAPVPDLPANGECGFWGGLGLVGSVVAPATRLGTLPFAVAGRFSAGFAIGHPARTNIRRLRAGGCCLAVASASAGGGWLPPWSGRELHPPASRCV